jgi:hypothetical protein
MMPGRDRNPSTSRQVTRSSVVDLHWLPCGSDPAYTLNADPGPGQTLPSLKLNFYKKKILYEGKRSLNIPT